MVHESVVVRGEKRAAAAFGKGTGHGPGYGRAVVGGRASTCRDVNMLLMISRRTLKQLFTRIKLIMGFI